MKNVISTDQLADKKLLDSLFKRATQLIEMPPSEYPKPLANLTIATIFFEPSTRTRLSFETAIQNLGGYVITVENAGEFSSTKKGESLEDTIKTLNAYADAIILRHPEIGAAERARKVSKVPIINAGDGGGDHPTQALLDVYTVRKSKKRIDGLKVAVAGDLLNSRTIRSFIQLLSLYDVQLMLVAPKSLRLPDKYLKLLKDSGRNFSQQESWDKIISSVDVLYANRIQKERFKFIEDYMALKDSFILTMKDVRKMKKDAIILDPLPRVNEIEVEVDSDPRAIYFEQVKNGLYVRMALLEHLFQS